MSFGYIKDKYYHALAKKIDGAINCGIKNIDLEFEDFEWMRKYFKEPERCTEFKYRNANIIKIVR